MDGSDSPARVTRLAGRVLMLIQLLLMLLTSNAQSRNERRIYMTYTYVRDSSFQSARATLEPGPIPAIARSISSQ
jgi:hypothetical protein